VDSGYGAVDSGQWVVDSGQWIVDSGYGAVLERASRMLRDG
jgi:hypothetical protein